MPNRQSHIEEKEHYESLISLFKYCITIITLLIGIIGAVVTFLTYSNGQEMREAFDKQKNEQKESINQIKADLKDQEVQLKAKELDMKTELTELAVGMRNQVNDARSLAVAQIAGIKDLATIEARTRIDDVFKVKNLDGFIEKVAQERMEPKIQHLVDDKLYKIEKEKTAKTDELISELTSADIVKANYAFNQLSIIGDISDEQFGKITKAYYKIKEINITAPLLIWMTNQKYSSQLETFFRDFLISEANNQTAVTYATKYLVRFSNEKDIDFYFQFLTKTKHKIYLIDLLMNAYTLNRPLAIKLCNSNKIVDLVCNNLQKIDFQPYSEALKYLTNNYKEDFEKTYLYKRLIII